VDAGGVRTNTVVEDQGEAVYSHRTRPQEPAHDDGRPSPTQVRSWD
jgi:hypothetical protein